MQIPSDLARSWLAIIIPGIVAVSPSALFLIQHTDATLGFGNNTTIAHSLFVALIVVAGYFCNVIGSYAEVTMDKRPKLRRIGVTRTWYDYLSKVLEKEPVGFRYISRLAMILQFELAMIAAAPVFVIGIAWLFAFRFPVVPIVIVGAALVLGAMLSAGIFHWQARQTHTVLCRTRYHLMQRLP